MDDAQQEAFIKKLSGALLEQNKTRTFSLREVILLGTVIAAGAGSWYVNQYRINQMQTFIQQYVKQADIRFNNIVQQQKTDENSLVQHIQTDLEQQIHEKDTMIKQLERKH